MWRKPIPQIDLDNRQLYERYKDHEFALYRCQECREWYFPRSLCREHDNEPYFGNIELEPASGRGTVFTYATTHRLFHEGFEDDLPYTFALIELDEGPMFGSQLVDVDADDVEVGLRVSVSFRDVPAAALPESKRDQLPFDDGFTLPYFGPVEGGESA